MNATFAQTKDEMLARKKADTRKSAFIAYGGVAILVLSLVATGYNDLTASRTEGNVAYVQQSNPLDQQVASVDTLAAATIASNIAESVQLPVAGDLREESSSIQIKTELAQNDAEMITKPQIMQPTSDNRTLITYTTVEGDSVQSVASKHGISADTVKWANNLATDGLDANKVLTLPPVDGVIYEVKSGDSIESITEKYKADRERAILFNDLETQELADGMKIVLPGGVLPENERPGYQAPNSRNRTTAPSVTSVPSTSFRYGASGSSGGNTITGYGTPMLSGNRYAFGNCTAYVYDKRQQAGRPVGGLWGNGNQWHISAVSNGFTVNGTPAVGSILQSIAGGGGYGHVAYVERVNSDGSVLISEMNFAGFNTVSTRTLSASEASMYNYIH
ncbi:CHAP domain-containing protein [Candidatus Saccharibacteria bacterium]|nr:CHAP domain-containing protein [Candidatus Saccharibacteria bacterium]